VRRKPQQVKKRIEERLEMLGTKYNFLGYQERYTEIFPTFLVANKYIIFGTKNRTGVVKYCSDEYDAVFFVRKDLQIRILTVKPNKVLESGLFL